MAISLSFWLILTPISRSSSVKLLMTVFWMVMVPSGGRMIVPIATFSFSSLNSRLGGRVRIKERSFTC